MFGWFSDARVWASRVNPARAVQDPAREGVWQDLECHIPLLIELRIAL